MKKILFHLFLLSFLLSSCSKNEIAIDKDNLLIGVWNFSHSDIDVQVYERAGDFIQTRGYRFNPDGTVVERNIAGFCGTPPVSYSDYPGTWTILKDNLVQMNITSFDGSRSYRLEIQSVTADSLRAVQVN
jgi:hypothetical protein